MDGKIVHFRSSSTEVSHRFKAPVSVGVGYFGSVNYPRGGIGRENGRRAWPPTVSPGDTSHSRSQATLQVHSTESISLTG